MYFQGGGAFLRVTVFALLMFSLLGCRNNYGPITPLLPVSTYFSPNPVVDSLHPVLRWQPYWSESVTYDVVIYKQYDAHLPGEQVYYREGISKTEHEVEDSLKPATKYFWSVRARQQDRVTSWAKWHGVAYGESWSNRLFGFETPPR